MAGRDGADASVLRLQGMMGNRAVARLLRRDVTTAREAGSEPRHFPLTSDADTLPGDPVPALSGHADFTEQDRKAAKEALKQRLALNEQRIPRFVAYYSGALVKIWTRYVTESMSGAAEEAGWSFFGKLASFVVRATLMTLFPEFEVEELAAEVLAHTTEKGAELGLELGAEKIEEHATKSSQIDKKKDELDEKSDALAEQLETVIIEAFKKVFEGREYETWIDNAPLSQLGLFRIPPLAPDLSRAQVQTLVAQAIAGFVHDDSSIWYDQENTVEVGFGIKLDSPGHVDVVTGPRFYGAAAFGREFEGATIRSLPKVPLLVELSHEENLDETDDWIYIRDRVGELFYGKPGSHDVPDWQLRQTPAGADVDRLTSIFDAYPHQKGSFATIDDPRHFSNLERGTRARITRDNEGHVEVRLGGLLEHLAIYEHAHPGTDWRALVREYARGIGDQVSPERTAEIAARELHDALGPSLTTGAEELIRLKVEPLTLPGKRRP
jgi:hypothetical protein